MTAQLEKLAAAMARGAGGKGGDEAKLPPSVEAWNDYYTDFVQPFVDASRKLNLADIAKLTEQGWKNVGDLIAAAPNAKKPSPGDLQKFVKPASDAIGTAGGLPDKRNDRFNHEKAFAELVMALGWVMAPKPMPHIQGQLEAGDFYLTKVLTTNKDATNKEDHRAFVKLAKEMLTEMKEYVKQWYRTGLEYKGQGTIFDKPKAGGGTGGGLAAAPPIGAIGAAAPPPPAAAAAPAKPASSGGASGFGAVLADLNKGSAITKGLKKVTADMKTKNRKDRSGVVKAAPKKSAAAGPRKTEVARPADIRLQRQQWIVEYQQPPKDGYPEPITLGGDQYPLETKQLVYILKCGDVVIDIPAKVKAVVIDGCKKTRVRVESVVSTVEVVNSQSVMLQLTGLVNAVAVDKTNGCQILCNPESADALELITSSISEVNVSVPGDNPDEDDPVEMPVPEQFKTVISGKGKTSKLVTESVKHG